MKIQNPRLNHHSTGKIVSHRKKTITTGVLISSALSQEYNVVATAGVPTTPSIMSALSDHSLLYDVERPVNPRRNLRQSVAGAFSATPFCCRCSPSLHYVGHRIWTCKQLLLISLPLSMVLSFLSLK
ncbi:unnamed protein product [Lactuca virosa]|uniref:Uncharacterized protein n=1 Tax=Lactuca virosa TaxID=75947 RepID=A0AAU9PJW5_9ASTR|nr:unnamed protein product [Lactuca virosa]